MPKATQKPERPGFKFGFYFLLLLAFLVVLFIYMGRLFAFFDLVWQSLLRAFGVGLILLALGGLVFLALRGWLSLLQRWHRWLGGGS